MLGISYGELFLIIGATAALIGPKDLPIIARTAGRLAGRAIGYVQLARGQFDNIMQQSQARQVHKELQDTMAQLEAIRHEIRSISFMNPGPMTRRLVDNLDETDSTNSGPPMSSGYTIPKPDKEDTSPAVPKPDKGDASPAMPKPDREDTSPAMPKPDREDTSPAMPKPNRENTSPAMPETDREDKSSIITAKTQNSKSSGLADMHRQATAYAKLAESMVLNPDSTENSKVMAELADTSGLFVVLPVSAESAGLLPNRRDKVTGSDIVLEAVVEADVAQNAKDFFVQAQKKKCD